MGYSKYLIGTTESQHLTRRCLEVTHDEPGAPVAMAIVDDTGELVSYQQAAFLS